MPPLGFKRATPAIIAPTEARLFWSTTDGTTCNLYHGHVIDALRLLPTKSVHCVVTSPPYWGLRDYGTAHMTWPDGWHGSYGAESTPRMFVEHTVMIFREVRRVLRDDGTLWLNLGDSYGSGEVGRHDTLQADGICEGESGVTAKRGIGTERKKGPSSRMPSGNLVGIPWRCALALQDDGWVLRQDIIWHKPAPMPESVRNRCTKAHEYVFLLTKSMRYYCDMEAIKEDSIRAGDIPGGCNKRDDSRGDSGEYAEIFSETPVASNRNKRSVWTVSSQGYAGAHFATFPRKLIEPMIKAGTSEHGCCGICGTPWNRVVERNRKATRPGTDSKAKDDDGDKMDGMVIGNRDPKRHDTETRTVGWQPGCVCNGKFVKQVINEGTDDEDTIVVYKGELALEDHSVGPCTVLDPFVGSGTSCDVSIALNRDSIGIDLSEKYLTHNAITRIEGALLRYPATRHLIPRR